MNRTSSLRRVIAVAASMTLAALTGACSSAPVETSGSGSEAMTACGQRVCDTGDDGTNSGCVLYPPPNELAAQGCGWGDGKAFPCPWGVESGWAMQCPRNASHLVVNISTNFDNGCISSRQMGLVVSEYCTNGNPGGCRGTCGTPE
jgi:hypothetical protein